MYLLKNKGTTSYTWYARDAQGNVMATYSSSGGASDLGQLPLSLSEQHIYGSSRLGMYAKLLNVDNGPKDMADSNSIKYYRGYRQYELSNHLGNVLATISDKKKGVDTDSDGIIDYYDADVTTAQDYYPFGMLMPGRIGYQSQGGWVSEPGASTPGDNGLPSEISIDNRTNNLPPEYTATSSVELSPGFESGSGDAFLAYISEDDGSGSSGGEGSSSLNGAYRYGFNGKENDNEVKGMGNALDFSGRIYDSRIGRWSSLDPVIKPWLSQYQFGGNNPINNIDPDGKDEIHFHYYTRSIVGSNGVRTGSTSARIEIIKTNGPDRFFHHSHVTEFKLPTSYSSGGSATWEKTTEFYPWKPESRSGLTSTSFMGLYSRKDRDYATLMKYATASPALKKYFEERSNDPSAGQFNQAAYKGLLSDMPLYNGLRKVQEYSELTAAVLSIAEGGLALGSAGVSAPTLPSRLTRVVQEKYAGSPTLGKAGSLDVFVADAAELKGLTSEQIAQKLTLVDKMVNL